MFDTKFENNIVHMNPNFAGPTGNHYTSIRDESQVDLANNLYDGLGIYSTCTGCNSDVNNVSNQPSLFIDFSNGNVNLQSLSPAIDA